MIKCSIYSNIAPSQFNNNFVCVHSYISTYRSEFVLKSESVQRNRLQGTCYFVRKSYRMYSTCLYVLSMNKTQNSESKKQQLRMKREK